MPTLFEHLNKLARVQADRLKRVMAEETVGKRVYLTLECGHKKLHNPRAPIPHSARCQECPDG